jgi:hypothetical protein
MRVLATGDRNGDGDAACGGVNMRGALVVLLVLPVLVGAQHTQGSGTDLDQRGAMVMGFDQQKTTHHFFLYENGGAIQVTVKDAGDTTDLDAIRLHLPHIAVMFGQGNFQNPMLVHDRPDVPGTAEMTRLKDRIAYRYREIQNGGRVDIVTTDPAAIAAVHEFLTFQISDHQTGDPLDIAKR